MAEVIHSTPEILVGRTAVDAYREAHRKLHEKAYYRGVHGDHTPLLNTMLGKFKKQGFSSIQEFFDASELQNVKELGFKDKADFDAKATEADTLALREKWQ